MQSNPVGWFEIYVDDMARARQFYESVLDVKLEKLDSPAKMEIDMWCFPNDMESYGASGALVYMSHVKAGGNSTLVYFSCEDCANEESRVSDNGGEVQVPKMAIGEYGFISVLCDTEGNTVGLHSMK
ncbi:VOC family protein [Vibrio anguillarum]|uniref:VOC family protein n=1 Tax=Vibrio anguillarum TaxID=55601 RepID=UPI00097E2537|nr:VOC family protein [Vibrio anguillarum]ASG01752.1 glyoxalase [Vibrio anguillarum]MBT2949700.1 VOC family protein [Vibrio anguillarum]